jgi:hypothetical protein
MPNVLKKITARAKQIYKAHPSRKWISCIKQASQEMKKGKKISGVKKKKAAPRRKRKSGSKIRRKKVGAIRTNRDGVDRKRVNVTIGSVSHHKSLAKKGIKDQIANKAGRRELVIKVRERRKLTKQIAKLKKDYRALC